MPLKLDRVLIGLLICATLLLFGRTWLSDHPEHDPWAPLSLGDQEGWATGRKVAALRGDLAVCTDFLARSEIAYEPLPAAGEGACRRDDRAILRLPGQEARLSPAGAQATCAISAGLARWLVHSVQPQAQRLLGSAVARIEHLGTANCRRIGGGDSGDWSEHATGNAIDIAGFVLEDGRQISVLRDWNGTGGAPEAKDDTAAFLRAVRDGACDSFATVLSPDYNAAHADHFHFDQANRAAGWSACR